jgi:predicted AlkP superfamily phosphohydrolase/phosphomutase
MPQSKRILVIGLDGATFDLIEPWVQQGYLPNLKRLMEAGAYGPLTSTLHPLTPAAWTTFMTGTNQGQHGIYNFVRRRAGSYAAEVLNASHITQPTFFEIASQAGLNVVSINVPYTYPPRPVKGVCVSGPFAPHVISEAIYPPERRSEIQQVVPDYFITPEYNPSVAEPLADFKQKLFKEIELRERLSLHLMRREPWDVFMVVFMATDMVQHAFWNQMASAPDAPAPHRHAIREVYVRVDQAIGTLLAEVNSQQTDRETVTFILSDHGAGELRGVVNLNSWLAHQGYLRFQSGQGFKQLRAAALKGIFNLYRNRVPAGLRQQVHRLIGGRGIYRVRDSLHSSVTATIDWEHTRAYALGGYGDIYINLAGREPAGTVQPGTEYSDLCQELSAALIALRAPDTGLPIIKCVHRGPELYAGDQLAYAPDLVVEWLDYSFLGGSHGGTNIPVFETYAEADGSRLPLFGSHRMHGILIAQGTGAPAGTQLAGARLLDLTPTLLRLLGILPLPNMDGQALEALLPAEAPSQPLAVYDPTASAAQLDYTPEEAEAVEEHLKSLGYL